jgi:zinc transporter ZupT
VSPFQLALLGSLAACTVTTAGIFAISRFEKWANTYSTYFVGFAAGILLAVSFLHLIPKSREMSASSPSFVLAGFIGLFLLSYVIDMRQTHLPSSTKTVGLLFMIGIGFHSFLDGVLYAVTFSVGTLTGLLTAIGMVLHEFPEGVITFVILNRERKDRRRSFLLAFLTAGATTPAGVLVSYPLVQVLSRPALGNLLGLSAGALTYVGATHLLPTVESERRPPLLAALGLGVGLVILFLTLKSL